MELGVRITRWREAKGLTQRQLADLVGVSPSAVCLWEQQAEKVSMSHSNLLKVIGALGLTEVKFYGRVPRPRRRSAPN